MSDEKGNEMNVRKILENVASEVCDNLCKYRETADDDLICDYIRENGKCPMDKLY